MTVTDVSTRARSPAPPAASAALALIAWAGVLLQLYVSVVLELEGGDSPLDGFVDYLAYFTVLTNVFVAAVATAHALPVGRAAALRRAGVAGCAVTAILLVGIVYHTVLRELWEPAGAQWLADVLLHYVVPAAALAWWWLQRGRVSLPTYAPWAWCLYPVLYLVYALLRGKWLGTYPYPFVDATALGYPRVIANSIGVAAAFVALGYLVRAIGSMRRD
jgi:hypothetical protein